MSIYAIVNSSTNVCDNMCVWDGASPWQPPPGHYTVLNDDGAGEIGWTYDPQTQAWTPPAPPPDPT